MKTTKAITLMMALLMLSAALALNAAHVFAAPPPKPTYVGFELTAYGTASDGTAVSLTLEGSLNGHSRMVFSLDVESGTASVDDYEPITIIKGSGVLVQPSEYVHLSIMTDKAYGGSHAAWVLKGETTGLSGDTAPISLSATKIILPQSTGSVRLTDLQLTGEIKFY